MAENGHLKTLEMTDFPDHGDFGIHVMQNGL
jgi:hypothetical protein